jgi:hypothetical protein
MNRKEFGLGIIEMYFRILPGGTEENDEYPQSP